jgi:hypothetical protein
MIQFCSLTGWNPDTDTEIETGDPIPSKPWLVCNINRLESQGRGAMVIEGYSQHFVYITHHILSRAAQRLETRTIEHLIAMARVSIGAAMELCEKNGIEHILEECPPGGYRVEMKEAGITVVLSKHKTRKALVAVTAYQGAPR